MILCTTAKLSVYHESICHCYFTCYAVNYKHKAYTKSVQLYLLKGSHLDDLEHAYIFLSRLLLKCKHRIKNKSCSKLMDACEYAPRLWGSTSLGYNVALWMHIPLCLSCPPCWVLRKYSVFLTFRYKKCTEHCQEEFKRKFFFLGLRCHTRVAKGASFNGIHLLQITISGAQHLNSLSGFRLYRPKYNWF